MNENWLYSDGHYCQPNGFMDYEFICPTLGRIGGFVPYLMRGLMNGKCACGVMVKDIHDREQPSYDNAKGRVGECKKCGCSRIHLNCDEHARRRNGWLILSYSLSAECIGCGQVYGGIEYINGEEGDSQKLRIKAAIQGAEL